MRTAVELDESLLKEAETLTGLHERDVLMRAALEALIERERAHQLARLGGTAPNLEDIPRRRFERCVPAAG